MQLDVDERIFALRSPIKKVGACDETLLHVNKRQAVIVAYSIFTFSEANFGMRCGIT